MINQYKYVIGIKQNNTYRSILDISNVGPNPTDNAWTDILFKILFNFVYTEFMTDFAISLPESAQLRFVFVICPA